MTDTDALLQRHQPRLYFDSQEVYFADSAREWTDNPGNVLRRAKADGGAEIASANGSPPRLTLEFLARDTYGDARTAVAKDDTISDPAQDYRSQAAELHADGRYANRIYGHAVEGSDHRTWLQYWCFYFYNDFAVAGFGLHEGDWEMVQLRLGADERPDLAVYAQHRHAEQRPWTKVERAPDDDHQPIVYVARGSHASYFKAGAHWTGVWFDQANGKRRSSHPATLEIVDHDRPSWICWPGWWGDTRKADASDPFDQESPHGPGEHDQWRDPVALIDRAAARPRTAPPPAPPLPSTLRARRDGGRLEVAYAFPSPAAGQAPPETLVVTVNSRDDRLPPTSWTYPVEHPAGAVSPDRQVPDDQRCDVNVSAVSGGGVATAAVELDLAAGQPSVEWSRG